MRILSCLMDLREFELKMGEMYSWFSSRFEKDEQLSGLFAEMAEEEHSHADLLNFEINILIKNRGMFRDTDADPEEIQRVASWIDLVMNSPKDPTLEEALKIASQFESDALEYHYRSALETTDPGLAKLMQALGKNDVGHFDKVNDFAESRRIFLDRKAS